MTRSKCSAAVLALLLVLSIAFAPPGSAKTAPEARPAAMLADPTPIATGAFTLSANYTKYDALNTALDAALPNVTVSTVMANANLTRQPLCHTAALSGLAGPVVGFCFESADDNSCHNWPQGITTTRDATGGDYDGHQLVVASWYYRDPCTADAPNSRSRITLVDWDADHPNEYRKVLLVEPVTSSAGPSFRNVGIHVGGIVWYGHYLYVADTSNGVRVFDMRKIWEVDHTGSGIGLQPDGSYDAHGYRYVLPQTGMVTDTGSSQLRWSAIGLDRTQPSIVQAEYLTGGPGKTARFPLDPATGKFVTDAAGTVHASQALVVPWTGLQGVVSRNGRMWWASSSAKRLYYWVPGQAAKSYPWVSWAEGLSYWGDPAKPDLLWTLREGPGDRNVFAVEQQYYD